MALKVIKGPAKAQELNDNFSYLDTNFEEKVKAIDGLRRTYNKKKATFCVIDDDCRGEVYSILRPILDARGIKGTFACITSQIGDPIRLSETQMVEMHNNGHEFISHSHSNSRLSELTELELENDFINSLQTLESLGMPTKYIAYPYGDFDKKVVDIAQKYFDAGMITDNWKNYSPLKTYTLGRIGVGKWGSSDWSNIKNKIDTVIEENTLGIIMTHVGDNDDSQNLLIEQTIDYIRSTGHEIKTFGEAFEYHKNLLEYGEFDAETRQVDFAVGYDGEMGGNNGGIYTRPQNTYLNDTPLSDFKSDAVTINTVDTSNASGFPFNAGGLLTTNKFGSSSSYGYQTYKITWFDSLYIRSNDATSGWGEWTPVSPVIQIDSSGITNSTPPSAFRNGFISIAKIPTADADSFPQGVGGLLTTNKIASSLYYTYQEYEISASTNKYRRYSTPSGTWGNWKRYVMETV